MKHKTVMLKRNMTSFVVLVLKGNFIVSIHKRQKCSLPCLNC